MTIDCLVLDPEPPPGYRYLWERVPNRPIAEARNYACERMMELGKDATHLMFKDSDATWAAGSQVRLFEHDLPVVCATMYTRDLPPIPTIGLFDRQEGDKTIFSYYETVQVIKKIAKENKLDEIHDDLRNDLIFPRVEGDIKEVDGMGMHFTMIRRDVIEAIKPPWFADGPGGAGEDYYFCRKAQQAGFKLYWDSGIHTGHVVGESRDFGIRELMYFYHFADKKYIDQIKSEIEARLAK